MEYSAEWAQAREDHEIAYDHHQTFAEAGVDNSPGEKAASDREYETLFAALKMPAVTPMDVRGKLLMIEERGIDAGWSDHWPAILDQIHNDLAAMARPSVSPQFAERFAVWREAELDFFHRGTDFDACAVSAAAFLKVMLVPCITPGDFIAKAYMHALGEFGSTDSRRGGFVFEIDTADIQGDSQCLDDIYRQSVLRDLAGCDLGRCLLALGRVDFDAGEWIEAAQRAGMFPHVRIDGAGGRGLYLAEPLLPRDWHEVSRISIVRPLISVEGRASAVMNHIDSNRPDLVVQDLQQEAAA